MIRAALRTGSWITPERLRAYPAIVLVITVLAVAGLWLTGHGLMDAWNRPLGTDFSQVWAAGVEMWAGNPDAPFDPATHAAEQRTLFGPETQFYGWHYPPYFLAVAALVALLPYGPALLVWQGVTLAAFLGVVRAIVGSTVPAALVLLATAGFPAVFVNLTHGHNGFLTAALLGGGLLALKRRPLLAGALLALLAYKPQFALAIPVALVAGRHWRALAAGAITLLAMTLASVLAFGLESWRAFHTSLAFTRTVVLEQGATGWEKIGSAFAAARMLGAGLPAAYMAQGMLTVGVLVVVALVWRGHADPRLKAALLPAAALLTTPYSLDYDMTVLGPALAFAVAHGLRRGFGSWEKSLLVLAWAAPGLARGVAGATHLPLGFAATLALFAVVAARSCPAAMRVEQPGPASGSPAARGVPASAGERASPASAPRAPRPA